MSNMADEQSMDASEDEAPSTVNNQTISSTKETLNVEKEISSPIPGFPPSFQFAKLQTEASCWSSNVASYTSCSDAIPDKTPSSVDKEVSCERSASSESNNDDEARPVNGLDIVMKMDEKPENVPEQDEEEEDNNKDEDGVINDEPDEEEAESDPYFYTKRDEFTSEIYKIELQNLPKKCGYKVAHMS